jgi:hypothetical protein
VAVAGAAKRSRTLGARRSRPEAGRGYSAPVRELRSRLLGTRSGATIARVSGASAQRFRAVLHEAERGGHVMEVPFDAREVFGEPRPPVEGTVNDAPLRSRLAVYGGKTYLGLAREIRAAAEIVVGDEVEVVLRRDGAPREVTVPPELSGAFEDAPDAAERFQGLSFTHRREYAEWVGGAKQAQTRRRRAERAIEMLREGKRRP